MDKAVCLDCSKQLPDGYKERCYVEDKSPFCRECAYTRTIEQLHAGRPIWMSLQYVVSLPVEDCLLAAAGDWKDRHEIFTSIAAKHGKKYNPLRPWNSLRGRWCVYSNNRVISFGSFVNFSNHNIAGKDGRFDAWFYDPAGYCWYGRACTGGMTAKFRRTKEMSKGYRNWPRLLPVDHEACFEPCQ